MSRGGAHLQFRLHRVGDHAAPALVGLSPLRLQSYLKDTGVLPLREGHIAYSDLAHDEFPGAQRQ